MSRRERCISCDRPLPPGGGIESAFTREDGSYCCECVATPRIALVGCGQSKIDLDEGETVPARDLYDSNYFQIKREYAVTCCDKWKILSAKHGLLSPDEEIESYDASLKPCSESHIGDYEAGKWAVQTSSSLSFFDFSQATHAEYVVLAGKDYLTHIEDELKSRSLNVSFPFPPDDLGGIGDQMGWLREQIDMHQLPGRSEIHSYATDGGSR